MRAVVLLVAALVLLGLQAAMVGVGMFAPHVTPQYRAFFIDHTTTDWVREKPLLQQ